MQVMMIAGEASGDAHGAGVVRELRKLSPSVTVVGIGGDRMQREGMEIVYHISSMAFMGFAEVVRNLGFIRSVERRMKELLVERAPAVVVLIDYPGFNLRFAKTASRHGAKVLYYISPQVWAWHKGRIRKMRSTVDSMKVVFPFEIELYTREGIDVEFVGHPLVESMDAPSTRDAFCRAHGLDPARKILGLFPGSRRQEIEQIFPTMVGAATRLVREHGVQAAVGVAPNLGRDVLAGYASPGSPVVFVEHATHDLMHHATAAIVTSGTATLETGWYGTPMAVVYRTSALTFMIGRLLVDVEHIGLVNIVAGKRVVPEFIQHDMTVENLVAAVAPMVLDDAVHRRIHNELAVIREKLGAPGASLRVARAVLAMGAAA